MLLWFGLALLLVAPSCGYIVEVPPNAESCFIEYVKTKRTAFLRIAVIEAGSGGDAAMDIRLKAYGPFEESPSEEQKKQEFFNQLVTTKVNEENDGVVHDGFNYDSEHRGGWYKYCLDNLHSSWQAKTVDFSTSYGLTSENELGHEDVQEEEAKQGNVSV